MQRSDLLHRQLTFAAKHVMDTLARSENRLEFPRCKPPLFDRKLLYSRDSRFVLAGIANRMDPAYLSEANCGEIRLIYRLTRTSAPEIGENAASPRLPMTLNVVLRARGEPQVDRDGKPITCAGIAQ